MATASRCDDDLTRQTRRHAEAKALDASMVSGAARFSSSRRIGEGLVPSLPVTRPHRCEPPSGAATSALSKAAMARCPLITASARAILNPRFQSPHERQGSGHLSRRSSRLSRRCGAGHNRDTPHASRIVRSRPPASRSTRNPSGTPLRKGSAPPKAAGLFLPMTSDICLAPAVGAG